MSEKSQQSDSLKEEQSKKSNVVIFTIERVHYDNKSGEKLSTPKTLRRTPKVFRQFAKESSKLGYTITLIEPKMTVDRYLKQIKS